MTTNDSQINIYEKFVVIYGYSCSWTSQAAEPSDAAVKERTRTICYLCAEKKNVKKFYSDFFTNKNCKLEAECHVFTACRPSDEHEQGVQIAHAHRFCAAFRPLKGPVLAPERHVFAQKDGPREKKALTFFHGDIPF